MKKSSESVSCRRAAIKGILEVDPQWIYVDLGTSHPINHVVLQWETAYAKAYQIQVSDDASTWTTVFSEANSDGGTDDITFAAVTARYVRMYATQQATNWGYSLWEFRVFGVPTNDAPVAVNDVYTTNEDTPFTATLGVDDLLQNDSDIDGDTLTVNTTPVVDVSNGTLVLNADGTFTYTPTANFNGSDSFTYEISDGNGGTAQATVTITVDPVTDLTATDDAFSTNEDAVLNADVSTNDSTTSGGALSYAVATGASNGSLSMNADGTFTYTPTSNYTGSDSFTYTVTDAASGESSTQTVTITVDPVLEPIATFSVDQIDFGSIDVGAISDSVPLVLTNSGTGPLTIENISVSQGFLQTNNCSGFLEAGGSCSFDIQFVPTTAGSASGSLTMTGNDSAGTHTVALSGAGTSPTPLIPSGPIVIDGQQDVVISGLHITNPTGDGIQVSGSSNIVIENCEIGPCGKGQASYSGNGIWIKSGSNNVTIRNNYIHDIYSHALTSGEAHHIAVDKNVIVNVWSGYEMWVTSEGYCSFTNNFVKNVGYYDFNGVNDPTRGDPNIVHVVYVHGPGIRVTDNIGVNILGESHTADLVNVYSSGGTASDPILIARNKFNGGGPLASGAGLQLGDEGGEYMVAEDNILVNPGGIGMGLAGGHDITYRNNKVYSANDPERPFTNVGLTATEPYDPPTGECRNFTIEYNEITFYQADNWNNNGYPAWRNPTYVPNIGGGSACGFAGWDTNKFDTESAQPANLDSSLWNPAWNSPSFLPDNPYFYSSG